MVADEQKEGGVYFFVGIYSLILKGKDGELNDVLVKPIYLVRTSFGRTKIKCYLCIDAPFLLKAGGVASKFNTNPRGLSSFNPNAQWEYSRNSSVGKTLTSALPVGAWAEPKIL